MKKPINQSDKPEKPVTKVGKKERAFKIQYTQPADLKTTLVSGAVSNLTPDMMLHIAFYAERRGFPDAATVTIAPDGTTSEEQEFTQSYVREIQYSALMDVKTAEYIISTIQFAVDTFKEATQRVKSREESDSQTEKSAK
jgi:hypothetical protein